jgi:hypothetical protein
MDDKQDPKVEVGAHRTIALFSVPRRVEIPQERIEKYLCSLLKRNAVLIGIQFGLVFIPAESNTSRFVFDIH